MSKSRPTNNQDGIFEKTFELGKDTARRAVKETVDTLFFGSLFDDETQKERARGNENFSDIDVQKLNKAYEEEDQAKIQELQRRINPQAAEEADEKKLKMDYHKRVQREEEETNLRKKQEKEEKERKEAMMEAAKKKQEEEEEKQAAIEIPKGKKRRSILGGEKHKATSELPPEFRPDAGKQ